MFFFTSITKKEYKLILDFPLSSYVSGEEALARLTGF
jgi:hypothetical protein